MKRERRDPIPMELTELYQKGKEQIKKKNLEFPLAAVETGYIFNHDRTVLDRFTFRQQCIDADEVDTRCQVLGVELATPVIMSPMGVTINSIVDGGYGQVALGLKEAGSLFWMGSQIPPGFKEIVKTRVPVAANVKPFKDREKMFRGIDFIQEAGAHWVGIEIDAGQGTKIGDQMRAIGCAPLSLKELTEVRKRVTGPLIFKGVLSRQDAVKSVEAGADGIVVSNHGAHTIDYLPHPLQVMDEIVSAVKGKAVILVDGGLRRGSDVIKGLAFGASLVGLGRPILYGLAAGGREGVRDVISGITNELKRIMSMVGAPEPSLVTRDVLTEDC
jgi:isopentenyl diphosphate isomerase/L-lactate dehydrogenase-like FMN-dependent dehydrogenase